MPDNVTRCPNCLNEEKSPREGGVVCQSCYNTYPFEKEELEKIESIFKEISTLHNLDVQ